MKKTELTENETITLHKVGNEATKLFLEDKCGKEMFNPKFDYKTITTLDAAFAITKSDEFEMIILKYTGENDRMLGAKAVLELFHVVEAINGGKELNWDNSKEYKYTNYWNMQSGGGFSDSNYADWCADSAVGSRLSFISSEHAAHAAKYFPTQYKLFMQKKHERK